MKICSKCGALNVRLTPVAPACRECGASLEHTPRTVRVPEGEHIYSRDEGIAPGCTRTLTRYRE